MALGGNVTPNSMRAVQLQLQSAIARIAKLEASAADLNAAVQPAVPALVGGGLQILTPTLTVAQSASSVVKANAADYAFTTPTIPFDAV